MYYVRENECRLIKVFIAETLCVSSETTALYRTRMNLREYIELTLYFFYPVCRLQCDKSTVLSLGNSVVKQLRLLSFLLLILLSLLNCLLVFCC